MVGRTAIGLDIGSSALRAAQVTTSRGRLVLGRIGQVELPVGAVRDGEVVDAPVVTAALRELWATHKFSGKRVHLGVANQRVIVREVDLPDMPLKDVDTALPFQVQDVLPIPVDTAILDFHPLERRQGPQGPTGPAVLHGLLVAASRDMVVANVAAVQAAGLTVASVDLNPFAVLRAVGVGLDADGDTEAIIDVGASVTTIIVHTARVPRFVRILLSGGARVTEGISERLGIAHAEAEAIKLGLDPDDRDADPRAVAAVLEESQQFIDDVRGSLDYYSASQPLHAPQRIVLTGGGAQLTGLVQRLSEGVRLPVVLADPLERFAATADAFDGAASAEMSPFSAVPVGLAMGAGL